MPMPFFAKQATSAALRQLQYVPSLTNLSNHIEPRADIHRRGMGGDLSSLQRRTGQGRGGPTGTGGRVSSDHRFQGMPSYQLLILLITTYKLSSLRPDEAERGR